MPSDAQLMQIALDDLNNSSLSLEDRQRALQELLILVEPIDNANGMSLLANASSSFWSIRRNSLSTLCHTAQLLIPVSRVDDAENVAF